MKTYVEFYNEKEDTFVKIPMSYEYHWYQDGNANVAVYRRC